MRLHTRIYRQVTQELGFHIYHKIPEITTVQKPRSLSAECKWAMHLDEVCLKIIHCLSLNEALPKSVFVFRLAETNRAVVMEHKT